jgi:hypothetical protein
MEKDRINKIILLILNTISFLVLLWFAYNAYYELFVFRPNIHYPRIGTLHEIFVLGTGKFSLNIPTLCNLLILCISLFSLYAVTMIYIIYIISPQRKTQKFWIMQIAGISICLLCVFIEMIDFLSNAFGGVG